MVQAFQNRGVLKGGKMGCVAAGIVAILLYNAASFLFSTLTSGKVLYRSEQPSQVHYGALDPYELRAVEGVSEWNVLGRSRLTEIWVSKKGDPDYGHEVTTSLREVDHVSWRIDGVEVFFARGHRLFIPKDSFLGGR